jgi:hypothetical protein
MNKVLSYVVALSLFALPIIAQTTTPSPSAADAQRAAEVDQRGDEGMGFSHAMTGHHFHLLPDGGSIEVESDSPEDNASKEAIRRHMQKIAEMFAQGDFSLPMFIHDTVPPGVEVMKRLRDQIVYTAENTANGAQVRIVTGSPEALVAVHEFLRFQIQDHRTNDPLATQVKPSAHLDAPSPMKQVLKQHSECFPLFFVGGRHI